MWIIKIPFQVDPLSFTAMLCCCMLLLCFQIKNEGSGIYESFMYPYTNSIYHKKKCRINSIYNLEVPFGWLIGSQFRNSVFWIRRVNSRFDPTQIWSCVPVVRMPAASLILIIIHSTGHNGYLWILRMQNIHYPITGGSSVYSSGGLQLTFQTEPMESKWFVAGCV